MALALARRGDLLPALRALEIEVRRTPDEPQPLAQLRGYQAHP